MKDAFVTRVLEPVGRSLHPAWVGDARGAKPYRLGCGRAPGGGSATPMANNGGPVKVLGYGTAPLAGVHIVEGEL